MPYKQAKSPYWWVSYTSSGGARIRRSTGTESLAEAKALESKWKLEAFKESKWDASPAYTFDELMVRYLKATNRTRDKYSVARLRKHFGGMVLAEITAEDVADYKNARAEKVSTGTIIKELHTLSAAINYAKAEWDWKLDNPVSKRVPSAPAGRIRWLSQDEANRLLQSAQRNKRAPWLAHFIRLGLQTGMRSGEILGLEWARVDLAKGMVYLDPEHQKSKTPGAVPLNPAAVSVLEALRALKSAHKRWVFARRGKRINSVKKAFRAVCEGARVADFTPHDLRHTCAAWLVQAGVPIRTVSELLRHKDIRTTMRYAHLAPENVREAVERLAGYDAIMTKPGQSMT